MIHLSQITDVCLIIFVGFYVVGTFWKPLIIRKKSMYKKTLAHWKINQIATEFQQKMLKIERDNAQTELKDLQQQIMDLKALKDDKQKELAELKKETGDVEKWKVKQKEIDEIDVEATGLLGEEGTANKTIKMAEGKIGEYTKELSILERSIKIGKSLIKDL